MCKVIPIELVDAKINEFKLKREAIAGEPFAEQTVVYLTAQITFLEDLRVAGEASADDMLTLQQAMDWSGLSRDALDAYPSVGRYGSKRWRRGDLPVRKAFSSGTTPPADPGAPSGSQDEDASARQERLKAALLESAA